MLLHFISSQLKLVNSARTITAKTLNLSKTLNSLTSKRQYSSFSITNPAKQNILCNLSSTRKMSTTSVNMKLLERFDNIVKSEKDKRLYRGLLLDNKMKCLLISDPTTDRSAASVDCEIGYMLDPKEFPGLAHFCEHMLFMGSEKVWLLVVFLKCGSVLKCYLIFLF